MGSTVAFFDCAGVGHRVEGTYPFLTSVATDGTYLNSRMGTGAGQIYYRRIAEFRQTPGKIIRTRPESVFKIYQLHFGYKSLFRFDRKIVLLMSRAVKKRHCAPPQKSVRKIAGILKCRMQWRRAAAGI